MQSHVPLLGKKKLLRLWNAVGQYYVYINDSKILQFDIAERPIDDGGTVIIVKESQLSNPFENNLKGHIVCIQNQLGVL